MSARPRWGIVLNPIHPAARSRVRALCALLDHRGIAWELALTTPVRPGAAQAARLAARGVQALAVVGGDGTLRACAQGLLGCGEDAAAAAPPSSAPEAPGAAPQPVLVPIPTGTANLFAGALGITRRTPLEALLAAPVRRVDAGHAELTRGRGDDHRETRIFLTAAGMGHDARTITRIRRRTAIRGLGHAGARWLAYPLAGVPLLGAAPFAARVRWEAAVGAGEETRVRAWSLLAGLGPGLPAPLRAFPGRADDGALDLLACCPRTSPVGRWADWAAVAASALPGRGAGGPALRGQHSRAGESPERAGDAAAARGTGAHPLRRARARTVVVEPLTPQPVQLDGEAVSGIVRLRAEALPGALRAAAPRIR